MKSLQQKGDNMNIEGNTVKLTGKVTYINTKRFDSGTVKTRVIIAKKTGDDKYSSFAMSFFKDKAEELAQKVKKHDSIAMEGFLTEEKYTKDGKEITRMDIVGRDFVKVVYDESAGKYVEDTGASKLPEDEKPWNN